MCINTSCCFCVRLRSATRIIGFFYTIISTATLVIYSVPLSLILDDLPPARQVFYGAMALSSVALFISSCMLLYGDFKRVPKFLWPWITSACCTSLPLAVACIAGMITVSFRAEDFDTATSEGYIISVYFVHSLLLFYFATIVNSRRREMEREKEENEATPALTYPIMYKDNIV